jgi:hypothetical protein
MSPISETFQNALTDLTIQPDSIKDDKYMDFLSDINAKLNDSKLALDYAFDRQPPQSPQENIDREILNTKDTIIFETDDVCRHKAVSLCTRTDPNMYITTGTVRFPPRWLLKPYANMSLPMHVDTPCYNRMYNCCKKKF